MSSPRRQTPRRVTHARRRAAGGFDPRRFDYDLDYKTLDLRRTPDLYRVGVGEQGVLLVEPYKSEILPRWRFRTPSEARGSAIEITKLFHAYRRAGDLVGMDMARKFLQMGYTRARRYANHRDGRKYAPDGSVRERRPDEAKAECAEIFKRAWAAVERNPTYARMKRAWRDRLG